MNWDVITNPVTGETVTFVARTPQQLIFDLQLPPGGPGIVAHHYAWIDAGRRRAGPCTVYLPAPTVPLNR